MFCPSYRQYSMKGLLVLPVVLILLLGSPAAANLSKGSEAVESRNDATSLKEWEALAEQGDADAQFNMGVVYLQGLGVTQDYQAAFNWFKKSTEQKHAIAQYSLGVMYLLGLGVTQDYKFAIKWFNLAAEQGDANAQTGLGVIYIKGWGVAQDYKAAFNWFKKAAEQGGSEAQAILSSMYEEGLGIPQDYTRAHMWWTIAASGGLVEVLNDQAAMEQIMTSTQINKAKKLAGECVAKNYKDC